MLRRFPTSPPSLSRLEDRWIRHQLNACAETVNRAFEQHRYHEAADAMRHFYWDDFCDWYLELKKPHFDDNAAHMVDIYETALSLLHPLMPFLTEELWQRLKRRASRSRWRRIRIRSGDGRPNAARDMAMLQAIITAARSLSADHKIDRKQELKGFLHAPGHSYHVCHAHLESIYQIANVRLDLHHSEPPKFEGAVRSTPDFDLVLEMPRAEGQREKLLKENEQLEKLIANQERQLSNEDFISKAPEKVVAGMRQKLAEYKAQLRKNLDALGDCREKNP